ncbi:polysaccharide deacetylase family protein [Peribacillus sp. SCS-26]|uniref:polysaccharide deacetylase family protein n=1 Tax=Paraperibacillus marinus TaxID=3115295 RepID=UPI003905D90F
MKRYFFNAVYTLLFALTFVFLISAFSDVLVEAIVPKKQSLPKNYNLDIRFCQKWAGGVRSFGIPEGKGAKEVTVLLYHRIIDDKAVNSKHYTENGKLHSTIVLKSQFEQQMRYLDQHGYTTLTTEEFQLFVENRMTVPEKSVLITFDDGFRDNYHEAYPILKKHHLTAVNFLITSYLSDTSPYQKGEVQYMNPDVIEKSCDVFEFQSHTYDFHQLTGDGTPYLQAKSKAEIKEDIAISLQNLKLERPMFAYPYGGFNDDSVQALKELNVKMAFNSEEGRVHPNMKKLLIPRVAVEPGDSLEDFIKLIE